MLQVQFKATMEHVGFAYAKCWSLRIRIFCFTCQEFGPEILFSAVDVLFQCLAAVNSIPVVDHLHRLDMGGSHLAMVGFHAERRIRSIQRSVAVHVSRLPYFLLRMSIDSLREVVFA